jgi:hypothetical protein
LSATKLPGGSPVTRRVLLGVVGAVVVGGLVIAVAVAAGLTNGPGPLVAATSSPTPDQTLAPTPSATPGPTASPTPLPTPTPTPTPIVGALDGLPVSEAVAQQRVVGVMIDDHADARPQSGLNAASIVWQAPAEAGIPRYLLLFQDRIPGAVGPIRSAREYFIEWAAEWDAVYVHVGGSPQAQDTLHLQGDGQWVWNADQFKWGGQYMWRINTRVAPHNVYTDGEHLRGLTMAVGASDGPIPPRWSFRPDAPPQDRATGGTISVAYSYESITYRYDSQTNTYPRYINGSSAAQVDAADGKVVAPKNVVILQMSFAPLDGVGVKGRLEAGNVGTGVAWISSNGRTVQGTWRKDGVTSPTLLFGPDGAPVQLTAGQTFVQVMATTDTISVADGVIPTKPARTTAPTS